MSRVPAPAPMQSAALDTRQRTQTCLVDGREFEMLAAEMAGGSPS